MGDTKGKARAVLNNLASRVAVQDDSFALDYVEAMECNRVRWRFWCFCERDDDCVVALDILECICVADERL